MKYNETLTNKNLSNPLQKRNSSIECLKVSAIILIILCHSIPHYPGEIGMVDLNYATSSFSKIIMLFLYYGGQFGNVIFVVCSAWFLLDSSKNNFNKVLYIMVDCLIISVGFCFVFLTLGFTLTVKDIVRSFFPITFENNWFIGCYLMLYITHPILNFAINKMKKKELLITVCGIFLIFFGVEFILPGTHRFSRYVGFMSIYFVVAYMKKYLKNTSHSIRYNFVILAVSSVSFVSLILLTNILGLHVSALSDKMLRWCNIKNPLIIIIVLTCFNLVRSREFVNPHINYISGSSLLIYILHRDALIKDRVELNFYQMIAQEGNHHILIWAFVVAMTMFFGALVMSIIYRHSVQKITQKLCDKLIKYLLKLFGRLFDVILRFD